MGTRSKPKEYHCMLCGYTDSQLFTFTDHMITHSKVYPHSCDICPARFAHAVQLQEHSRLVHKKVLTSSIDMSEDYCQPHRTFTCPKCDFRACRIDSFRKHATEHTGLYRYECYLCSDTFHYTYQIENHLARQHKQSKAEIKYNIDKCKNNDWAIATVDLYDGVSNFKLDASFYSNKKSVKNRKYAKKIAKDIKYTKSESVSKNTEYRCEQCGITFRSKLRYASHVFDNHGAKAGEKGYRSARELETAHIDVDDLNNNPGVGEKSCDLPLRIDRVYSAADDSDSEDYCSIVSAQGARKLRGGGPEFF